MNKRTEKLKLERMGEENANYQGCLMKIIKYNKANDIVVEFQDKYKYNVKTSYGSFKKGSIKNLYHPTVHGVGIVGNKHTEKVRGNGKLLYEYKTWVCMLERCYSKKLKKRQSTYKNSSCCKEWLLFENFYEWLHKQENFDKHKYVNLFLDKDILVKGNKIYSPETCCLVPKNVNQIFTKANAIRGDMPIGVRRFKMPNGIVKFSACCSKDNKYVHLGLHETPEEAFNVYKKYKENLIKETAKLEFEKGNITKECYNAMMNYEVEITD